MFVALIQKEFVIYPKANNDLSLSFIEDAITLYHIVVENSFKHFTIRKLNVALTVFRVIFKLSFVVGPSVS